MYGYATDETEELMPLTIVLAHKLNKQMADYRRDGTCPWIRPDSKSQVQKYGRVYTYYVLSFGRMYGYIAMYVVKCWPRVVCCVQ